MGVHQHRIAARAAVLVFGLGSAVAHAGTLKTVTINDEYSDWAGVPVLASDGGDVGPASGPDIGDTQIANDADNLYLRNTFPNGVAMSTFIALDIDSNTTTGFDIFGLGLIGSEAGWQNDFAFAQGTGVFNSGALGGDFFGGGHALLAPFANATSRELAISLDAVFASNNAPVFPDDTFTLLLWTNEGDVSGPFTYTLAPVPEPAALSLIGLAAIGLRRRRRA